MELVGREVRKAFPGHGTFFGVVESYDPAAGYFKIQYEDGDSEEVDFEEVSVLLGGMVVPVLEGRPRRSNRGRRPKKRRRVPLDRALPSGSGDGHLSNGVSGEGFDGFSMEVGISEVKGEDMVGNSGVLAGSLEEIGFLGVVEEVKVIVNCLDGDPKENSLTPASEECFSGVEVGLETKDALDAVEKMQMNDKELLEDQNDDGCLVEPTLNGCINDSEEYSEENGPRKRQRLSEKPKSTPEMPLRRSARRASACPPLDHLAFEDALASGNAEPEIGASDMLVEDFKPVLPPSSSDLDIEGLPVLDFFSVYTCLRSFCRLLFLSPFSLEAFVAALRCRFANSLIDSIHFSILQTLKPQLKFLAEEGSQSAAACIRNLNWELLDVVTWPVYLAEYLLLCGSATKAGFKLNPLKQLLSAEYYKQPPIVKLEILSYLCDDLVEVEAIRSELYRRMKDLDVDVDTMCNIKAERITKDSVMIDSGFSSPEMFEGTTDGNSDECCLCRLDGILICCDGCPAAFHSRCVGVAKDLLPEGDWFCPECVIAKGDRIGKIKAPRGAEILGIDPHGRLYFVSCGRLLVFDSSNKSGSYHYYNKNDLSAVVEVLKSCSASYCAIVNVILKYFVPFSEVSCPSSHLFDAIDIGHEYLHAQMNPDLLQQGETDTVVAGNFGQKQNESSVLTEQVDPINSVDLDLIKLDPLTKDDFKGSAEVLSSSEPAREIVHTANCVNISRRTRAQRSVDADSQVQEVGSLQLTDVALGQKNCIRLPGWGSKLLAKDQGKSGACRFDPSNYVNCYIFGRLSSLVAEDLLHGSSENSNKESKKSAEDTKSSQLKAIYKKFSKGCWYNYQSLFVDMQREKCGWCFTCKMSTDGDCLFSIMEDTQQECSKTKTVGLRSGKNKKSHIACAMHYLLSIEDRLRGLLSGDWENPHYSSHWRKAVLKASDVASLKQLLLTLESNLRRVALSAEWLKPVDSAHTVGSASHVLTSSVHVPSYRGGNRKPSKKNTYVEEFCLVAGSATASDVYWWRGGRLSRQIFQWKMLPRRLAFKAGRQAGCSKISGLFYPDGVESAKRSKYVAWQAAVETSKSVAQLICQVKDFAASIRWMDIANTQLFPQLVKEPKKLARSLKNVTIRRKCIEGTNIKYLLDFGKRGAIPASVTRHGVMLEETSNGRRRYWLIESHVPLNLLKAFEEKNLARLSKKIPERPVSGKEWNFKTNKPQRLADLSHLISRGHISEKQLCGHCNKDVFIREAVKCQLCEGFFHKKHFRVLKGAVCTTCTCRNCKERVRTKCKVQVQKIKSKKRRVASSKRAQERPSAERPRGRPKKGKQPKKGKHITVQCKEKLHGFKRRRKCLSKGPVSEKSEADISWRKRKRTVVHHSYWSNGVLWSRKTGEECCRSFRKRKVLLPTEHTADSNMQPVCCLCNEKYNSGAIYVSCENCEDWFHGDVFCLTLENINNLIGLRCYKCRMRSPPVCSFLKGSVSGGVQSQNELHADLEAMGHRNPNDEDKIQYVVSEDCPADVHMETFVDERRIHCLSHAEEEPVLCSTTGAIEEGLVVQTFEHAETELISSEEANGIQIGITSEKIEDGSKEIMVVPSLVVFNALSDSAKLP